MPPVQCAVYFEIIWHWSSEFDFLAIDIRAAIQVVIAHPLGQVLHMALIRLEHSLHDGAFSQQIGKSGHMEWIKEIDLEVELIPYVEAIERNAFDQRDTRNELGVAIVHIPPVANGKGEID